MSIIEDFVAYAQSINYEDIPTEILHAAKMLLVDTVGVCCYAAKSDTVKRFMQYIDSHPALPEATAIAQGKKVSIMDAALINGIMAHVDDFDEVSIPGHTGVSAVPAVLALGEYYKTTGKEMMRAFILGIELKYRLAELMTDKSTEIGWHTTPVFGTLGSAATAALIMDLTPEEFANALALAASQSSGLQANWGTMAKPFHAGMATARGIECAMLSKCGVNANPLALEAPKGYMDCFSTGIQKPAKIDFYDGWSFMKNGLRFKKYPCCIAIFASVETLKSMMLKYRFKAEDVVSLKSGLYPSGYDAMRYKMPQNGLEAKFSMAFPLAMVLLHGDLRARDFTDQIVTMPAHQEMMKKITVEVEQKYAFQYTSLNKPCTLRAVLKDGRILEEEGELGKPSIKDITDKELYTKYMGCTQSVLPDENAKTAYQLFMRLESENNINTLMELLR